MQQSTQQTLWLQQLRTLLVQSDEWQNVSSNVEKDFRNASSSTFLCDLPAEERDRLFGSVYQGLDLTLFKKKVSSLMADMLSREAEIKLKEREGRLYARSGSSVPIPSSTSEINRDAVVAEVSSVGLASLLAEIDSIGVHSGSGALIGRLPMLLHKPLGPQLRLQVWRLLLQSPYLQPGRQGVSLKQQQAKVDSALQKRCEALLKHRFPALLQQPLFLDAMTTVMAVHSASDLVQALRTEEKNKQRHVLLSFFPASFVCANINWPVRVQDAENEEDPDVLLQAALGSPAYMLAVPIVHVFMQRVPPPDTDFLVARLDALLTSPAWPRKFARLSAC